jgi:hypothetical protein
MKVWVQKNIRKLNYQKLLKSKTIYLKINKHQISNKIIKNKKALLLVNLKISLK